MKWRWNGENTVWIDCLAGGKEEEKEMRDSIIHGGSITCHSDGSGIQQSFYRRIDSLLSLSSPFFLSLFVRTVT
ncbi:hypothetical protein ACN38_g4517 [Penicillium nordicum]|uniref:Uncharacterized protein n=1 Tax=Penicillium nordicum TaxID=229535 RepID=A0A0M8PBA8_9EURO|nr:hypothetical protein ACN38_g4517 [Penicillium nordicum]